jgi:phosphate transport system substrate-binding protein
MEEDLMNDRSSAIRSLGVKLGVGVALGATLLLAACGSSSTSGNTVSCPSTKSLNGAGATFPALLYSQEFAAFAHSTCQIKVNYQAVGSGAGISQLLAQTVDFGATDSPMTDADLAKSTNGPILHIPAALGGVAISYNLTLPSGSPRLKFKGETIANIFLGKITKWNDPAIAADNSGVTLPDQAITVVHRSDGSGTTGIFTHYLAAVSPDWAAGPKFGTTINWPTGVGAKGNDGVANQVKNTTGAIGYNELGYVLQNGISYGAVQNKDGTAFLEPNTDTVTAAAGAATDIPDDLRFFIVNEPGANAYPISGFSWIIAYQNQKDADKGQALAQSLWYQIHTGNQLFSVPSYSPLPDSIVVKGEGQIKALKCGSDACFKGEIK